MDRLVQALSAVRMGSQRRFPTPFQEQGLDNVLGPSVPAKPVDKKLKLRWVQARGGLDSRRKNGPSLGLHAGSILSGALP